MQAGDRIAPCRERSKPPLAFQRAFYFHENAAEFSMKIHLKFDLAYGMLKGQIRPNGHPQDVMRELRITYQHATPQSVADQWWFWNCKNIPESLPGYLSELNVDPIDIIGFGLSEEDAIKIRDGG